MQERNLIAGLSVFFLVIVAFTPIVPILLESYEITNIYAIKASIGLLSLLCSYGFIWAVFKKENENKTRREGKRHMRPRFLIAGIAIICMAWFTDVPLWLSNWSGLSEVFVFSNDIMEGGFGARVFLSMFTAIGVLLIKYSTFRDKERIDNRPNVSDETYHNMLNREGGVKW